MAAQGYPTLTFSLRGIAALEFTVHGPTQDLHSGVFGGAVMNPATAAARLVASLHDDDGRVAIEGFYNDVRPMFDWEREAAAALPIADADVCKLAGVTELTGEPGFTAIERVGARPTAEVNGIGGGYQGEGTKTVLPREAFAKLTFRLVPTQRPEEILRLAEAHLRARCPKGVRLEIFLGHCGEPYYIGSKLALRKSGLPRFGTRVWPEARPDARRRIDPYRHDLQEGSWRGLTVVGVGLPGLPRALAEREFPAGEFFRGHSPQPGDDRRDRPLELMS